MKAKEFVKLVAEMRGAQKKYFQTRDHSWLVASKDLEAKVDSELKKLTGVDLFTENYKKDFFNGK